MSEIQPGDSFDKSVGSGKGVIEDKGTCSHSEGDGDEEQRGDGGDTSENDSDDGDGSSSDSDSDTDEEVSMDAALGCLS